MNDVLYAIYDDGIEKTKDLQEKIKIINLTSATEAGIKWENYHKGGIIDNSHGTDVLYAVINRLQSLEGRINKDWVQKIIDKKLTFVDSHPYSAMPFNVPGQAYEGLQFIYEKIPVQNIPYLQKLEAKDCIQLPFKARAQTLAFQYLAQFTNISVSFPIDHLNKEGSDLFSRAIDKNFVGAKQSLLITKAAGNQAKTSSAYESISNNRHVTTIGIYDASYGTAGPNVFASDCGTFFSKGSADYISGTSFASPAASSIGVFIHQINPHFNWRDYQNLIANSVSLTRRESSLLSIYGELNFESYNPIVTGETNWNGGGRTHAHKFGFGFIDAEAWLLLAASVQPNKDEEKILNKQMNLNGNEQWHINFEINDNIKIEHITVDLNAIQQKAENISLSIKSPKGVIYPILKPHDSGGQTSTNFTFLTVAARGEDSIGRWTLLGEGPAGSNWGNFQASVNFYGTAINKLQRQDIIYTNDIAAPILQEMDPNFENRLTIMNVEGEKRLNCASVYPNKLGDGTVKIDLNPGMSSNINGQVVKIDPKSQPINAAYGGGSHDIIIGNQYDNELIGGPGDDYLDGGLGKDSYEISSYPFYDVSNHDVIDITADDQIVRKDGSIEEMVFYETNQGQILGILGWFDPVTNTLSLSQKDTICLNLRDVSPKQLVFKDNKKTYIFKPLIISYDQGLLRKTVKLWRPKTSENPSIVWLPQDAKNIVIDSHASEEARKLRQCDVKLVKHELVGALLSSQKDQYQNLLDNLLIDHGFKAATKTEDSKIIKENRHWIEEKTKIYLNLDRNPKSKLYNYNILVKEILSAPVLTQLFNVKDIESIVIDGKDLDEYLKFKGAYGDVKQRVFNLTDLEKLQFHAFNNISNVSMTLHFKKTNFIAFTVNGSREEWVDPTTYKGYVVEQPSLTSGVALPSDQNYQGYYHVHVKLTQDLPQFFAVMGLPLEEMVIAAKLDKIFTVTNTTLKITKLSEVAGGDVHLYDNYGKIQPTILNITKDQEVTLATQKPAILLSRSKIQEKDSALGHIVKISNGDKHLVVTTSVGLNTKPAAFDLKGFLVANGLVK